MIKVAVTELEYNKASGVFDHASGFQCLPAPGTESELAGFIRKNGISYVIVGVDKYQDELYSSLPQGGVIARFGIGHDGIDKALAESRRIFCTNTPGALDNSVAECAIGLMLSAARHLAECIADNRHGVWMNRVGSELYGKTLAIIGCGRIGSITAKIARDGFGMKIVGFDIFPPRDMSYIDSFHQDFARTVEDADFVSLHIPDIPVNKNFINAERLAMMKQWAIVINTARGGILDENALYDAVSNGVIGGAALDVFKTEPYSPQAPDKDLRFLPEILMTPHVGSSTQAACNRMARAALRNIELCAMGHIESMDLVNK